MSNYHRYPGELKQADPGQFMNYARWCAICGTNQPQLGGTIKHVFGGRHFVCAKHKKVKPNA
jgi:alpha-D-ribose 1-methylphosphonate 5-phosphate C-P lyase